MTVIYSLMTWFNYNLLGQTSWEWSSCPLIILNEDYGICCKFCKLIKNDIKRIVFTGDSECYNLSEGDPHALEVLNDIETILQWSFRKSIYYWTLQQISLNYYLR